MDDHTPALATQPATSQEGEACARDNSTDLAHIRGDLKALATQPATSQEGEEPTCERCDRGVCVDPHYEDDDRLNRPAAAPTPPTLSEDLRETLQPFADAAADYDYHDGQPAFDEYPDASSLPEINNLTIGQLRRARAALAQVKAS